MKAKYVCFALVWGAVSSSAWAQWQWIDEGGRRVFSDRPPPTHIDPSKILRSPHRTTPVYQLPKAPSPPTEAQEPAAPSPQVAATDKAPPEAEAPLTREQQAAVAEQEAKAKQEAARLAREQQENCRRAQAALGTLQSGAPVSHVDAQGRRGFMSAEQRQKDMAHARRIISQDCK